MTDHPVSGTPASAYPPAAYAPAPAADLKRVPPVPLVRWLLLPAVAGILVGVAWWLLAPGGAFIGSGKDFAHWPLRDLVLGGLGVLAGITMAVLLAPSVGRPRAVPRVITAVVGGLLGSLVAWQIGLFAGHLFAPVAADASNPSIAFSLRSPSILLLWPLAVAAVVFLVTLVGQFSGPAKLER